MDHSVQSYLGRQSTDTLLALLWDYREKDDDASKYICDIIRSILLQRNAISS